MTQEQKAKAYDEALKVLHKYDGANIMFTQDLKEEMFPEIRESEDERIRKKLISYFSAVKGFSTLEYNYGISNEDAIAWLEKQGKQKSAEWSEKEQQIIKDAACFILACVNTAETKEEEKRLEELADKLQDLRPQKQWKPSKEQLYYLSWIANIKLGDSVVEQEVSKHLNELYEQLKQL